MCLHLSVESRPPPSAAGRRRATGALHGHLNGNLAKEAGRLHHWRERLWGRRYHSSLVSDEPSKQVDRLRYLLEQGCKEGLVRRPQDWPGATSVEALLTGKPLVGLWYDRTAEYEARRRGKLPTKYDFAEEESFALAPLPAWHRLSAQEIQHRVHRIVRTIESETRQRIRDTDRAPLGVRRILRQDPHQVPARTKRSPAPRFHARHPHVRRGLELAYRAFRFAYRQAAEALRSGDATAATAEFPAGSFPPRLPFARGRPTPSLA